MTLLKDLYEVYNHNSKQVGMVNYYEDTEMKSSILLPLLYKKSKISYIITCTKEGKLVGIQQTTETRILPCTLQSLARSSGSAPHIVHDNCKYVASDSGEQEKHFSNYVSQLAQYRALHPVYEAVYQFVQQYPVLSLLQKVAGDLEIKPSEAYVYFEVEEEPGIPYNQFTRSFYEQHWATQLSGFAQRKTAYCYITDCVQPIMTVHPNAIRYSADSTKLISQPTNPDFLTFQSKFDAAEDAFSISVEASLKAHSALSWLIDKQGVTVNKRVYLLFSTKNSPIQDIFSSFLQNSEDTLDTKEALKLQDIYKGNYKKLLLQNEEYIYVVLDSTDGKGRLSVLEYQRFAPAEYEQILANWDEARAHHLTYGKEYPISFYDILRASYWDTKQKKLRIKDNQYKNLYFKIRYNVMQSQPLAPFFEQKLVVEALKGATDKKEWQRRLMTLLAVLRYNNFMRGGEVVPQNRSYYWGQIAAVLEQIESAARAGEQEKRATVTERLMSKLYQRPADAYGFIYQKLTPYLVRLQKQSPGAHYNLKNELNELVVTVNQEQGFTNDNLDPQFFVGYSDKLVQMKQAAIARKKAKEANNESDSNKEN